ncbi:MAG: transcription termination/antitermination protein NusA [Lachnospiraceae bacterium]|nr:transcription termination/antitermination protein NusA [Lachnospiraceae bacterium]
MNSELIESLNVLEKEKDINKEVMFEAIENSLLMAYKNHYGKNDNVTATVDRVTGDFKIIADKVVVDVVEDPSCQISIEKAKEIDVNSDIGDTIKVDVKSKEFGRIATQNAKNIILQKIREEERKVVYEQYYAKEKDIVTGIVQRINGKNISINLGKADAVLIESEQVKNEVFMPTERIKLYVTEVKETSKGPKISVSRSHPELVRRLFEAEVAEVRDGTVEIVNVAREAGIRSKITVKSNNKDVDPLGACVGINGSRVNAIVNELRGEKIDIVPYSENAAIFVENALSPAKVVSVIADDEAKTARVVVPDYQLSLAIGKEGINARLAAKLTGFKIDIKSETQAKAEFGEDFSGELTKQQEDEIAEDENNSEEFIQMDEQQDGE